MQQLMTSAAEAADTKLHYTKRVDRAKFSASTLTQTLALGFLAHPDASVEQLAHSAARVGVDVSPQAGSAHSGEGALANRVAVQME